MGIGCHIYRPREIHWDMNWDMNWDNYWDMNWDNYWDMNWDMIQDDISSKWLVVYIPLWKI